MDGQVPIPNLEVLFDKEKYQLDTTGVFLLTLENFVDGTELDMIVRDLK